MKAFIGLGSNIGDPRAALERAAKIISEKIGPLRASPRLQTQALLPAGAPADWDRLFVNAVIELDWEGDAPRLLALLKEIERELGRVDGPRWGPRVIDLDLLALGNTRWQSSECHVPHPEASKRSFVLDAWLQLAPSLQIPGENASLLSCARALSQRNPVWMGILNLTPDSFSDGGGLEHLADVAAKVEAWENAGIEIFDLGAESTRPGANPVDAHEEWRRLEPALLYLRERYQGKIFKPIVSVDTRHVSTAARAIALGARLINDVSGLADSEMAELLASEKDCEYVLMHSLSVPANPDIVLPAAMNVCTALTEFALDKLAVLAKYGVSENRVHFDPGIGFGKTATQSLQILREVKTLQKLPVRLLYGHSRKSFLTRFSSREASERDALSIGISLALAQAGVEVIRVHNPELHAEAWLAHASIR